MPWLRSWRVACFRAVVLRAGRIRPHKRNGGVIILDRRFSPCESKIMTIQEASATCRRCGPVLARRPGTNHVLHLLVTLFTCSLWIPIWILASVRIGGWKCPKCGGSVRAVPSLVSILFAGFLLVIFFAVLSVGYIASQNKKDVPPANPKAENPLRSDVGSKASPPAATPSQNEPENGRTAGESTAAPTRPASGGSPSIPEAETTPKPTETSPPFPTDSRTWRSVDGRSLIGKIIGANPEKKTIDIQRADGAVFKDFPVSNLAPEDAALIHLDKVETSKGERAE